MRRICIYCQTWESGGIESFLSNVLQHMDLSDLRIDIVADVLKASVFTGRLEALGITFRELSGSPRALMRNYRRFARLLDEQSYDVVHLNLFQALPLAYLSLARRKGIPLRIAHSHNNMLRQSKTRQLKLGIHKLARRLFAKDATDLWACSDTAAKFMFPAVLLSEKHYRFIPNGIDLHRFQSSETERGAIRKQLGLEKAFVIGNVGRLCHQKNQDFLLDVFAQVYAQDASARLLLVGEGEALTELEEKAAQRSLSDSVIFYGTTPQVERLLWAMDVFVFPSIFEGLGIAAIEAQAAGLPTICSDGVPQEAFATDLVQKLSVHIPAEQWAQAILTAKDKPGAGRPWKQLKAKGFDVADVANFISGSYQRDLVTKY